MRTILYAPLYVYWSRKHGKAWLVARPEVGIVQQFDQVELRGTARTVVGSPVHDDLPEKPRATIFLERGHAECLLNTT